MDDARLKQNYEVKNDKIRAVFHDLKCRHPERLRRRLNLSWSNEDVYHMQTEEEHIGEALLAAGDRLVNLHMADYPAMHGRPDKKTLDEIVRQTTVYFREREEALLAVA